MVIRSVLWVGTAEGLAASGLPEAPGFDVVWERDVGVAGGLPLARFDAAVVEGADDALARAAAMRLAKQRSDLPVVCLREGRVDPAALSGWLEKQASASPERSPRAHHSDGLIGESSALQNVRWLAQRAARSRANVLILGETGTGKELVARAIHTASLRSHAPFVAVNCAAFPDTLLESELLGHMRGAFSGAERDRKGLIEEANGGTLFLDEVAETSPAFQAKLLRVLQERVVRPLGGNRERPVDVRILAATHRDLRRCVATAKFREDLYYRLAVFPIPVPPLRERPDDLRALVLHFLTRHAAERAPDPAVAEDLWPLLLAHRWPGNVRELENEIQRALALAEPGEALERRHFSRQLGAALEPLEAADLPPLPDLPDEPLRDTVARLEAILIRRVLQANAGRRSETARRLGLTREGLYKKMKRLGIE